MKRITAMLLMICLCLMGQSVLAEEKVGKIAVAQEPTKMDYWVGEEFSAEGGVLLVTYRDKTTAEIPMTDENVKLPNVKTNTPGRKAVKVTYGGKNVTFYINVAEKGAEVTFELNYDGAPEAQKEAARRQGVEAPENPVRDGYTFDAWYTDAACTVLYDFCAGGGAAHDALCELAGGRCRVLSCDVQLELLRRAAGWLCAAGEVRRNGASVVIDAGTRRI